MTKTAIRKVSRGFQVTLPPYFRKQNHINIGDMVEVYQQEKSLVIKPFQPDKSSKKDLVESLFKAFEESVANSEFKDQDEDEIITLVDDEIKELRK